MRTFEKYINRRNITDATAYFVAKGITTDEQLHEWCENHEVEPPSNSLFGSTTAEEASAPAPKKAPAAKKTSAKRVTAPEDSTETWHVPAAERPLKKQVKKSPPKKRKATK